MRLLTSSIFSIVLSFTAFSQNVTMVWDIYADRLPSSMHVQILSDGEVMQDLDLRGSNALELDIPIDTRATLLVSTPSHKTREVIIDTHHAFDDKKQAKQNKKFAYDLYLEGKNEKIDESYMLRTVSYEAGTSKILFDEDLAEVQD